MFEKIMHCMKNTIWEGSWGQDVLVLTDCEETAQKAAGDGACVIAVLTEENKECFFSGIPYAVENPDELDCVYIETVYRRYKGLPLKILETKRCIVREITLEDVDRLYEIYKEPSITYYMENLFEDREKEKQYTRDYIDYVYGFYGYGMWIIEEKESGKIIGRAGVEHKEKEDAVEMGYVIATDWQGKGYGYEVCSKIVEYTKAVLGINNIYSYIRKGNFASEALCRKLNWKQAGEEEIKGKKYTLWEGQRET